MKRIISFTFLLWALQAFANVVKLPIVFIEPWPTTSGNIYDVVDDDLSTAWLSKACRAGDWKINNLFNSLLGSCEAGLCSGSCNSSDLMFATDGSQYTASTVRMNHGSGLSWVDYPFPRGSARIVQEVYIRGIWPLETELLAIIDGGDLLNISVINPSDNYNDLSFVVPAVPISGFRYTHMRIRKNSFGIVPDSRMGRDASVTLYRLLL